jgi:amidase
MSDVAFRRAVDVARMIRSKEIGSVELTEHYIARIERHDGEINAVVVHDFERARAADARLAVGEPAGPLHGVPMTIKDSYDVSGLPTTWGIPLFKDNVAGRDAEVVTRPAHR